MYPSNSSLLAHRWQAVLAGGVAGLVISLAVFGWLAPTQLPDGWQGLGSAALGLLVAPWAALGGGVGLIAGERGLLRRTRLYNAAFEAMSPAVCVVDGRHRLAFCNDNYLSMCQMTRDRAWTGRPFIDMLEERRALGTFSGDAAAYIASCARRIEDADNRAVIERGDRVYSVSESRMPDGGWIATLSDITERRQSEREIATAAVEQERRAAIEEAIAAFRTHVAETIGKVGGQIAALRTTATALFAASEQTSERVENAVKTSNAASMNVESAALAADEMSCSIAEISRQLGQTNEVVRTAAAQARTANDEIGGLSGAAQKIGDVVKMIQDIAGQTNLLALNATIEAARAGEAGRGFSVVASEVKSLAVQTARATEEIAGQIAAVQSSSTEVVGAIRLLADRMQEINAYSSAVAASLQQQNAATGEITQHVGSAASGAKTIVASLGVVADATRQTRGSAQTVLAAAQAVEAAATELHAQVQSFLTKVA
ncbi:MAG TPA: methyl-accepting chemotaxis protein [Xanthobacteraceae bacterium]|nr:methyl-accepting chemotaxis protein [Xanthobacteraceae bacterium]